MISNILTFETTPEDKITSIYFVGILAVIIVELFSGNLYLTDYYIHRGTWSIQLGACLILLRLLYLKISIVNLFCIALAFFTGVATLQFLFRNTNDPFESAAHIFLIFALGLSIVTLLHIIPQSKITYTTMLNDANKKYANSNFLLSIRKTMYLIIVTACGAVVATPIKVFKLYEERLFEIFLGEIVISILFTVTASLPVSIIAGNTINKSEHLFLYCLAIGVVNFSNVVFEGCFESRLGYQLIFLTGVAYAALVSIFTSRRPEMMNSIGGC